MSYGWHIIKRRDAHSLYLKTDLKFLDRPKQKVCLRYKNGIQLRDCLWFNSTEHIMKKGGCQFYRTRE